MNSERSASSAPRVSFPWMSTALMELESAGLKRARRRVTPHADGTCEIDEQLLKNFASNDYLSLAHDPRVIRSARTAMENAGAGSRGSALICGRTDWHVLLEDKLREFKQSEAALLFPTGYAANLGVVSALTTEDDLVLSDELNHASLIDGCRLSNAEVAVYPHNDMETLRKRLAAASGYRQRIIVTDGLFSMDGDVAQLNEICDLCDRYDASVIVDEAHATGVLGIHGRGSAEWMEVEDRVDVRIGTLSKAIGSQGGFVTGSGPLIDWLWNKARTQIFSTSLSPACCAAAMTAIEIIQNEPQRREQLLASSHRFRKKLRALGVRFHEHAAGPIVPIILNDPGRAVQIASELERYGFLVGAIRPPSVPEGTSRLRITLSFAHADKTNDQLAELLAELINTRSKPKSPPQKPR
ncbi:8-amino-7-oxononanoate synthase 2 [Polystyrenella longa]|uniref:8-amino-7-ketopelargonate synthase n=1 Tax=Polystyrenella longa TaxID=2528007 RepID=A0A518CN10_9PLAN|nr:8-amino-7-oxononanoate synthase [Polystyrenella longa]QDU80607.1 8-amino-7-oxononanoate synthase 2 [Polystyrenella longa]